MLYVIGVKMDTKHVRIFVTIKPINIFSQQVLSIDKIFVVKKPKQVKRNRAIVLDKNNAIIIWLILSVDDRWIK
jgi:hypothetical protein